MSPIGFDSWYPLAMLRRYSFVIAALLGVLTTLVLLAGVVMAMPNEAAATPARPTPVIIPTPTPTPLPIMTPTPTPGPAGDNPDATIAPFGDG
jgi:hypothetical protein